MENPGERISNPEAYSDDEASLLRDEVRKTEKYFTAIFYVAYGTVIFFAFMVLSQRAFTSLAIDIVLTVITLLLGSEKKLKHTVIAAACWAILPHFGTGGFTGWCTDAWFVTGLPIVIMYVIGFKKIKRYEELSKMPGFPYFSFRREEKYHHAYVTPRMDGKEQTAAYFDDITVKISDIAVETKKAIQSDREEKKHMEGLRRVNPDIETRSELLRQTEMINRFFKVLAIINTALLPLTIARFALGNLIAIRVDPSKFSLPTVVELIAALVFAIMALISTRKNVAVIAATAVLWVALPRYGNWEMIAAGGGYTELYVILNLGMAAAYGYGTVLASRWKKLSEMPDFPTFFEHAEDYEDACERTFYEKKETAVEASKRILNAGKIYAEENSMDAAEKAPELPAGMDGISFEKAMEAAENQTPESYEETAMDEASASEAEQIRDADYYRRKSNEESGGFSEMDGIS